MATLRVTLSISAPTVNDAVSRLAAQYAQVVSILRRNGLNSTNYAASSLNIYPNYSYANGQSNIVGQIAS